MPLRWSISHEDRLVVVHIESELRAQDVQTAYAAVTAAGAAPYRKLVDLSFAPLTTGVAGIKALAHNSGRPAKDVPRGPVAFVVGCELAQDMIELFERQMPLDRPMRMFRDHQSARRWLDEVAAPVRAYSETSVS